MVSGKNDMIWHSVIFEKSMPEAVDKGLSITCIGKVAENEDTVSEYEID
jgi:hypothetical protein